MNGYGEAAVIAAGLVRSGEASDPSDAWGRATAQVFTSSEDLRNKGCPKAAFIGLCCHGSIAGIDASSSTRITKNGKYAIDAAEILRENRFIASQPDLLWKKVARRSKTHNHQIDVVIGLWDAGLLRT